MESALPTSDHGSEDSSAEVTRRLTDWSSGDLISPETAAALGVSTGTVVDDFRSARARLYPGLRAVRAADGGR